MPSTVAIHGRGSTAITDRMPSPNLWRTCPLESIQNGTVAGKYIWDDFLNVPGMISDQTTQQYDTYIDTGVTINANQGAEHGEVEIGGNDADNDEGVMSTHGPVANISDSVGAAFPLWFEARVSKASVADDALGMFVGLGYDHGNVVTVAKTLCLTDNAAALGAFSFIGFHVDQADGDAMDFVYKADGQTAVVKIAGVHVPVANAFVKVGFRYNPLAPSDKRIAVFVNNQEQSTYVTAANIETATFPDAEDLALVWASKVGTGSAIVLSQMDWWRFAQLA